MQVFGAYRSYPDYNAPSPILVSLHMTFEGARRALYPDKDYEFTKSNYSPGTWNGPDGFGMIRLLEVNDV